MGYHTEFKGSFKLNRQLDVVHHAVEGSSNILKTALAAFEMKDGATASGFVHEVE